MQNVQSKCHCRYSWISEVYFMHFSMCSILIRSNFRLRRSENLHEDSHQNSWTHVQSVQNCWCSSLNMQIFDVLVAVAVSICQAPPITTETTTRIRHSKTQVCNICKMKTIVSNRYSWYERRIHFERKFKCSPISSSPNLVLHVVIS